jgi:hypothetical protein
MDLSYPLPVIAARGGVDEALTGESAGRVLSIDSFSSGTVG